MNVNSDIIDNKSEEEKIISKYLERETVPIFGILSEVSKCIKLEYIHTVGDNGEIVKYYSSINTIKIDYDGILKALRGEDFINKIIKMTLKDTEYSEYPSGRKAVYLTYSSILKCFNEKKLLPNDEETKIKRKKAKGYMLLFREAVYYDTKTYDTDTE